MLLLYTAWSIRVLPGTTKGTAHPAVREPLNGSKPLSRGTWWVSPPRDQDHADPFSP
jgi:hypothetical protein